MRTTIDYGIDLGTTNSSIAVCEGATVEAIRNNQNRESTPSAVFIGRNGEVVVGDPAAQRLMKEPQNGAREFKSGMGAGRQHKFARFERSMTVPQLSAEVLKSLRIDVQQRRGEDITAAVITVPAAFELPQCDATQEAARLAGFSVSHLVTEPAAAAFAFSRQAAATKAFWLVYDLGGGTFDAAVIQLRDGSVQIVNHGGDNQLGGKLIDWAIVDDVLVPALLRERRLTEFNRGNAKWRTAFAALKYHAELAKIQLSRTSTEFVEINDLCVDDRGERVSFDFELTRAAVEGCARPYLERSVNFCRRVLAERRLGPGDVDRVILVGGPTLTPLLREFVKETLGIPIDHTMDPMTVVAQGAAIYAASQRHENPSPSTGVRAGYDVALDYKPVGAEPEFLVGGTVRGPEGTPEPGLTIEFANPTAQPPWSGGRIALASTGTFMAQLWAQGRGIRNKYSVELRDASGSLLLALPDHVTYMIDVEMADPQLLQSLGVALRNNEVDLFFKKGDTLPAKKGKVFRVAVDVKRGLAGSAIRIPLIEGENPRADRNQEIGCVVIESSRLTRDVPAGSEIEVTIHMDKSRVMKINAFLHLNDQEFDEALSYDNYQKEASNTAALQASFEREKRRLDEARKKALETGDAAAITALRPIDTERIPHDVESALAAANGDPDAAAKAQKRLLDLRIALDSVEDALEWPALVARAEKEIGVERSIVDDVQHKATAEERASFIRLEKETRNAIANRDKGTLKGRVDELDRLGLLIVIRSPGFWVGRLHHLEGRRHQMTSPTQADGFLTLGRRAIGNNDLDGLKAAVLQLEGLLPDGDPGRDARLSSLTK